MHNPISIFLYLVSIILYLQLNIHYPCKLSQIKNHIHIHLTIPLSQICHPGIIAPQPWPFPTSIRIFQFLSLKTICWDIYDGWLHSWGLNASFNTHIYIHTYDVCQSTIHVIYDIYDILHLTYMYMSIWVSKEALRPQECSQPS